MPAREGQFPTPKQVVLIVLCYDTEIKGSYLQYLLRVKNYIVQSYNFANKVSFVLTCGGETRKKSYPGVKEGAVAAEFLCDQLDSTHPLQILSEEESTTTGENIIKAKKRLRGFIYPDKHKIVVWCNALHSLEVRDLLNIYFPDFDSQIEAYDISGKRPCIAERRLLGTVVGMLGVRFPPIAWLESWLVQFKIARA